MTERERLLARISELRGDSAPFAEETIEALRMAVADYERVAKLYAERGRLAAIWSVPPRVLPDVEGEE